MVEPLEAVHVPILPKTDRQPRWTAGRPAGSTAPCTAKAVWMLKMNTRIETERRVPRLTAGKPAKGIVDVRCAVAAALRRLGQRSTATVIAEEMGCPIHAFPDLLIAMLADHGDTFTADPLGRGPKRLDGIQFGLIEWRRDSDRDRRAPSLSAGRAGP